ncbi:hypothetical protein ACFFRR_000868 [Megaselia abdita]
MKVLSSLIVLLAFVAATLAYTSQWGARRNPDRLLYTDNVFNATRAGQSITRDVYFPKNGQAVKNITLIRAVDNVNNGTGAYPTLLSGGPGFRYSNIRFSSQRNYGINFRIEYYGN